MASLAPVFLATLLSAAYAAPLHAESHLQVRVVNEAPTAADLPPEFAVDLDGDGVIDPVQYSANQGKIHIQLSAGGAFDYDFGEALHDLSLKFVRLPGQPLPSILTARTAEPWRPSGNRDQLLFVNTHGQFRPVSLGLDLFGRSLDCLPPTSDSLVCLYASYSGRSKLIRLDSAGAVVDLTASSGIGTLLADGTTLDGWFMMGVKFLDFTGDGLPDLVAVGQHSQVFSAVGSDGSGEHLGHFHFDARAGEYMRVYAAPLAAGAEAKPCVYAAMERLESSFDDYVKCYDRTTGVWYDLPLPTPAVRMDYDYVPMWFDAVSRQTLFAAHDADGKWRIYAIEPQ